MLALARGLAPGPGPMAPWAHEPWAHGPAPWRWPHGPARGPGPIVLALALGPLFQGPGPAYSLLVVGIPAILWAPC